MWLPSKLSKSKRIPQQGARKSHYLTKMWMSLLPGGEQKQHNAAPLCGGYHEPLDPADGLPCGHHRHPDWKYHPETLLVGPRLCTRHAFRLQVGSVFKVSREYAENTVCVHIGPWQPKLTCSLCLSVFTHTCTAGWMWLQLWVVCPCYVDKDCWSRTAALASWQKRWDLFQVCVQSDERMMGTIEKRVCFFSSPSNRNKQRLCAGC